MKSARLVGLAILLAVVMSPLTDCATRVFAQGIIVAGPGATVVVSSTQVNVGTNGDGMIVAGPGSTVVVQRLVVPQQVQNVQKKEEAKAPQGVKVRIQTMDDFSKAKLGAEGPAFQDATLTGLPQKLIFMMGTDKIKTTNLVSITFSEMNPVLILWLPFDFSVTFGGMNNATVIYSSNDGKEVHEIKGVFTADTTKDLVFEIDKGTGAVRDLKVGQVKKVYFK
jgi:hypothetical protein